MNILNTGVYIRVSTEEQAKFGYSIKAQKEKLLNYALIKEWKIYDIYIDEGLSGKDLNRPKIIKLLKDIEDNKVNNVLVFKIDRLTRSTKDLINLIEFFQKKNCEFNSLTESIDTSSPTGRMFIKIIGLFAEFERETIAERIKLGLERKVKEGYSICSSTVSYGYMKEKGNNIQKINKEESYIVKKIYKEYLNGKSIKEIKNELITKNIKTKKGKEWTNKTIRDILKNPNYIGKVRYGLNNKKYFEKEGKHRAIISKSDYISVNNLLKNELRTNKDAYYSNKIICMCNKRLSTKRIYIKKKCYINYICNNKDCLFKMISHIKLDKYLKIKDLSTNNKYFYVQNNIYKIAIVSLKKNKLIVYKNVNIINNNFTLVKK